MAEATDRVEQPQAMEVDAGTSATRVEPKLGAMEETDQLKAVPASVTDQVKAAPAVVTDQVDPPKAAPVTGQTFTTDVVYTVKARPEEEREYLLNIKASGLTKAFSANDSRSDTVRGLWPGEAMADDDVILKLKLAELCKFLVADTYGSVAVVRMAREAYNSRQRACSWESGMVV